MRRQHKLYFFPPSLTSLEDTANPPRPLQKQLSLREAPHWGSTDLTLSLITVPTYTSHSKSEGPWRRELPGIHRNLGKALKFCGMFKGVREFTLKAQGSPAHVV